MNRRRDPQPGHGDQGSLAHHRDDTIGNLHAIMQNRTFLASRYHKAAIIIGAIGENLRDDPEPFDGSSLFKSAAGNSKKSEIAIDRTRRAGNGARNIFVFHRDIAQGAMRLHMGDPVPGIGCKRLRRTDLIGNKTFDFSVRERQTSAAKTPEIRKPRMRPDCDAVAFCRAECRRHHFGIATVKTARHIGARDDGEHRRIIAHLVGAEAFAAIAIEINALHPQSIARRRFARQGSTGFLTHARL